MRTSFQNMDWINRPTVKFHYVVIGTKDTHGKLSVHTVNVYTNKRAAMRRFRMADLDDSREFISIYEVNGRTKYASPEFKASQPKTRWGIDW